MKTIFLTLLALITCMCMNAQNNFSDDLESYTLGGTLASQSTHWTTWSGAAGGADDIAISNTDAHSGTQSIFFTSTTSTGGPADIVLPFGSLRTVGDFEFTSWFKMPTGKGGYFNFQGTQTMGSIFALNNFFESDGTLIIQSSSDVVLTTTFPQGAWFEYKLVADLNTNSWELFINNTSQGTFQLDDFTIFAIDYYSINTDNAFWVDDVSYNYTPFTLPALNAAVARIGVENGLVTQERTPTVTIRNLGTTAITSFDLEVEANGTSSTQSFTGLNISSGATYEAIVNNSFALVSGSNTVSATVSNVNGLGTDDNVADDSKTHSLTPTLAGTNKIVVAEEATGTWCGWCPRGAVMLDNMTKDFDGFFQGIAVHNGDPMTIPTYDGQLPGVSGYPSALTDRGVARDPSFIRFDFFDRIVLTPVAALTNGAELDNNTLKVSVTTDFAAAASGNYKLACVIVEDSVTGTSSGYAQANYYSGGSNGVMGGFESLPNPVPASMMQHDHVARDIQPSFAGLSNAFPASVNAGDSYLHNFSFDISAWNKDKLHIVSLLLAPDGTIENAGTATVSEAIDNGYVLNNDGLEVLASAYSIYPNPSKDEVKLQINAKKGFEANIKITDVTGRILMSDNRDVLAGTNIIPIRLEGLASGSYLVTIAVDDSIETLSFTKE